MDASGWRSDEPITYDEVSQRWLSLAAHPELSIAATKGRREFLPDRVTTALLLSEDPLAVRFRSLFSDEVKKEVDGPVWKVLRNRAQPGASFSEQRLIEALGGRFPTKAISIAATLGNQRVTAWAVALGALRKSGPVKQADWSWWSTPVEVNLGRGRRVVLTRGARPPEVTSGVLVGVTPGPEIGSRTEIQESLEGRAGTAQVTLDVAVTQPRVIPGPNLLTLPPLETLEDGFESALVSQAGWLLGRDQEWFLALSGPEAQESPEAWDRWSKGLALLLSVFRDETSVTLSFGGPAPPEELDAFLENPRPDPFNLAIAHFGNSQRLAEAHPAASDRPLGEDHLNTGKVAQALAWTVALKETATPLCVGIFGAWGTGKSFLLRQLSEELRELDANAPPDLREKLVDRVRLVSFNAWTYAKGDLWSALLFEILTVLQKDRDLPRGLQLQRLAKARKMLEEKVTERDEKKEELERRRQAQGRTREASEQVARYARYRLEALETELAQAKSGLGVARGRAWQKFFAAVLPWAEQKSPRKRIQTLLGWGVILAGLVALVVVVEQETGIVSWLLSALVALAGFVGLLLKSWRGFQEELEPEREAWRTLSAKYQEMSEEVRGRWQGLEETVDTETQREIDQLAEEVQQLEADVGSAREELHQALDAYGEPVASRSLSDFLASRLEQGDYAARLGPLQQVQQDLKELAAILLSDPAEPTSPDGEDGDRPTIQPLPQGNRVVLLIDDLDRCPPDQVVRVLEAVQLLLAENEYLAAAGWPFVVVLGADTRILTRAIEVAYPGILDREGRPNGLDYLEKIVQLPYRIPPVDSGRYVSYLAKLTGLPEPGQTPPEAPPAPPPEEAAQETSAAEVELGPLRWTLSAGEPLLVDEDLEALAGFSALAPKHPRAIKRILNQYRLIKLLGSDRGTFAAYEVAFLLSLAGGYLLATRQLVRELREGPPPPPPPAAQPEVIDLLRRLEAARLAELAAAAGLPPPPLSPPPPVAAPGIVPGERDLGSRDLLVRELRALIARLDRDSPDPVLAPNLELLQLILDDVVPFCFLGDLDSPSL